MHDRALTRIRAHPPGERARGGPIVLLGTARFVRGVGGARSWAGALPWLVAEAPPDRRGALVGTALGAAIAGSLFGPVIGGVAEATSPEVVFGSVLVFTGVLGAWALRTPLTHQPVHQGVSDVPSRSESRGWRPACGSSRCPRSASWRSA